MAEPDAASVTWWDPASLDLEIEQLAPLRHQRLLEVDSGGVTAAESTRNYETWKTERRTLLARGSEPSVQVQMVTALVRSSERRELRTEPSVDVHVLERDVNRPGGRRFGTLVHALLALIDLESKTDALRKTAAVQGRILGATEEEIDAAVATV
jgi:hypothetical protein